MSRTDELIIEANRQLNICNACRYCEGYCAVFPALERRTKLGIGDLAQLANLCHDCRDCYFACMYIPPHDFALNPPQLLSELRQVTYEDCVAPGLPFGHLLGPRRGLGVAAAIVSLVLITLIAGTEGLGSLLRSAHRSGSPYSVISYPALLSIALAASVWSIFVIINAGARFWNTTHGKLRELWQAVALTKAVGYAGSLKYLGGGGVGCSYPRDNSGAGRRWFHHAIAYGFLLCLASTISAAILQDLLGSQPPYALVSAPVILGLTGGIGLVIGSAGLLYLKRKSDPAPSDAAMSVRDHSLLLALLALSVSGLLVLLLRGTPVFGVVLLVHLCSVITCIVIAPYSKFIHGLFRFLAIVQDNLESSTEGRLAPR